MKTTYERKGSLYGHFSPKRQKDMEAIGRDGAREYVRQLGSVAYDNDIGPDGKLDCSKPDLRAVIQEREVFIEAATKGDDIWRYIYEGVDVEKRKLKYGDMLVFMVKQDGSEALIIPGYCIRAAQDSCGDEYYGQRVPSSENFVMPEHGCHRVRKKCRQTDGSYKPEDFYRIPYRYVVHLAKKSGKYRVIKSKESFSC